MSKKEKKPDKYDEKVKLDIPAEWGFDDTLKAVVKPDSHTDVPLESGASKRIVQYGSPNQPVIIGEFQIQCFVLNDETRVISQRSLYNFLGIRRGGAKGDFKVGGVAPDWCVFLIS